MPEPVTLLEQIRAEGREPVLPENPAPHLTDWLLEIGPVVGEHAIGWQDMAAWSRITGVELSPWEARTIRKLSKSFIDQRYMARKASCREPLAVVNEKQARKRVDDQFAAMMRAIQAAQSQS